MTLLIILIITLLLFILGGNLFLIKLYIKKSTKRFVIPILESKGYLLTDYKWVVFWGDGDFKNEQMNFALFKTGLNSISIFAYIYYKGSDNIKRITIKIDIVSLSIDNVTYSSEI
jgi:hypothetical protein